MFKVCDLKRKYLVMKKRYKMRVKLEHWNCLLDKFVVMVETNSHWKYQIKAVNDYHNEIHDFVGVETHVVLPFGVVMAYATVPNPPLPTKWSNQNQCLHARFKCRISSGQLQVFTNPTCSQHVLFCALKLVLLWGWRVKLFHLHHVMISISMAFLSNTIKIGFIPICRKKSWKM